MKNGPSCCLMADLDQPKDMWACWLSAIAPSACPVRPSGARRIRSGTNRKTIHWPRRTQEAIRSRSNHPDEIVAALRDGNRVDLRGFSAFSAKSRRARTGRNPPTGSAVEVIASRTTAFRCGKGLRARHNRQSSWLANFRERAHDRDGVPLVRLRSALPLQRRRQSVAPSRSWRRRHRCQTNPGGGAKTHIDEGICQEDNPLH